MTRKQDHLAAAIKTMRGAGAVVQLTPPKRLAYSLALAGELLSMKPKTMRRHLKEFPNKWRLPSKRPNGGEWRIPLRDLEAFEARRQEVEQRIAELS